MSASSGPVGRRTPCISRVETKRWFRLSCYIEDLGLPRNDVFAWPCAPQPRRWVLTPLRHTARVATSTPEFRVCCTLPIDADLDQVPRWLAAEFWAATEGWDEVRALCKQSKRVARYLADLPKAADERMDAQRTMAAQIASAHLAGSYALSVIARVDP